MGTDQSNWVHLLHVGKGSAAKNITNPTPETLGRDSVLIPFTLISSYVLFSLVPPPPTPSTTTTTMASLSTLGGFTAGALAACGAVTITNPMEVVKTRLQLQGELAAKGQVKRVYTGVFQALRIIALNEGIKGIAFCHRI